MSQSVHRYAFLGRHARAALGTLLAAAFTGAGAATLPSTTPQVRVVQDMHTAPIEQIRTDARFERLVTSSNDKTLRVWRLSDLQLLRTLYLPSEASLEGTPYSIAVSADGRRAYAAGYTGWDWARAGHVYVFDLDAGRITGKLGRFDGQVVTALDLSADGSRLAVGLGTAGLVVVDTSSGATLQADAGYALPPRFVHYAADGRLATTSADGCLRIYGADGHLLYRNQFPALPPDQPQCTGHSLGGVRFSPDGRWLAVGSQERNEVGLFDAHTFQLRRSIRGKDADQQSLCCIAWSPDSRTLYVNGLVVGDQPTPLYRVRDPASGALERWNVGQQQINNMLPLPDGSIVFATTVPSITRVSAEGRISQHRDGQPLSVVPDNLDFHRTRHQPDRLLVSADGRSVAAEVVAGRWLRANPLQSDPSSVLSGDGTRDPDLFPVRRIGAVSVTTAVGPTAYLRPTLVNQQPVTLAFQEGVRSWAVHASLPIAALGTQWRVHLVDARGRPMPGWEEPPFLSAPAFHTVITEDGRWVVVAVGDGTLRWFEVASGRERLGLFIHANLIDWVAWRPDGYYASSPQGDRFVGWLVNRGDAQSPDFFRAVQFERSLYRPDLLQAAFVGEAGRSALAGAAPFTLMAPRVHIEAVLPATREVRFTVEAPAGGGMAVAEVGVYADGVPVLDAAQRKAPADRARFERTVRIPSGLSMEAIRVEAEAANVFGLDEAGAPQPAPASPGRKGKLWLVAVGVEHFTDFAGCGDAKVCRVRLADLPNAPNDALMLADAMKAQASRAFTEVRLTVLTDRAGGAPPTKAAVLQALDQLQVAGPEDTVAVFMASHGIAGGPGGAEYYFLTADAQVSGVEWALSLAAGQRPPPGANGASLLSATELADRLRRVAGRRMVLIDTCHSGAADGQSNPHSMAKRSASAQVGVLAASNGLELSYESAKPGVKHGAFTEALLRGLAGQADADNDGWVTLAELSAYAGPEVARNTELLNAAERSRNPKHRDFSQTPTLFANPAIRRAGLSATREAGLAEKFARAIEPMR